MCEYVQTIPLPGVPFTLSPRWNYGLILHDGVSVPVHTDLYLQTQAREPPVHELREREVSVNDSLGHKTGLIYKYNEGYTTVLSQEECRQS